MNTTENISIAGYAFTIETDAYEELKAYLADIRKCFEGNAGADEITSDIEERIAELLNERCSIGMVVNTKMINDILQRIGRPEELVPNDGEKQEVPDAHTNSSRKTRKAKRLYRNVDEKVLGGVCSGLGMYFTLDKVLFRIMFLIFFAIGILNEDRLSWIAVIAYICLWIAMPAARSVEQKCEMKGKPIDLEGFKDKDFDLKKEAKDIIQSPAVHTFKRAGMIFLGLSLLLAGCAGLIGCVLIPSVPELIGSNTLNLHGILDEIDLNEIYSFEYIFTGTAFWSLVLVMLALLSSWMVYNGVILTFDLKSPKWKPGVVLFIAWIISLLIISAWLIHEIAVVLPTLI